jgi:hypothetical protein
MSEPKDIFDQFREESDRLTETPSGDTWQRLEKRLATRRAVRRERRPVQMQLAVVSAIVGLLCIIGIVSWLATRQHQAILRGQEQFRQLSFLEGKWFAADDKAMDEMTWVLEDSFSFKGLKTLYYDDSLLTQTAVHIKNQGEENHFIFKNKTYTLEDVRNDTYTFRAKDKEVVRLRKQAHDRLTLSYGEGFIFIFKKKQP